MMRNDFCDSLQLWSTKKEYNVLQSNPIQISVIFVRHFILNEKKQNVYRMPKYLQPLKLRQYVDTVVE